MNSAFERRGGAGPRRTGCRGSRSGDDRVYGWQRDSEHQPSRSACVFNCSSLPAHRSHTQPAAPPTNSSSSEVRSFTSIPGTSHITQTHAAMKISVRLPNHGARSIMNSIAPLDDVADAHDALCVRPEIEPIRAGSDPHAMRFPPYPAGTRCRSRSPNGETGSFTDGEGT